ncbi:hypothetical protein CQW23_29743 [Capsicum baccatum]|uniref:Uncharacterized protein n=1 Tax=Capsicum baccatum TaxID=33114 RepID=A0A2G2VCE7_CAPBA|nr:hypothetical protein CQW23_29743 [Capsicum baccatum]
MIIPDFGIPHTLAPMKQSIQNNGEDVTNAKSLLEGGMLLEENEVECSNTAHKLTFSDTLQEVEYKDFGFSDHTHIVLITNLTVMHVRRTFRLLNVVMLQDDFKDRTRSMWQQQVPDYKMYSIWRKLSNITGQAKGLQKEMSVVDKRVEDYKTKLNQVQEGLKSSLFNQELIVEER